MGKNSVRIALPRIPELEALAEHFSSVGFDVGGVAPADLGEMSDPLESGFDFEFVVLPAADVGTYVEHGVCHAGVMTTDVIRENDVSVWRPFTFNFGKYPLVLAAHKGQTLATLSAKPILRPATPFPRFAKDWFTARGIATQIVHVTEHPEMAVQLGLADCWVDRLTEPTYIVERGFRVLESMGHSYLKLVVNPATGAKRRAAIRQLIGALSDNMPPEPTPISIPFDLEDPL